MNEDRRHAQGPGDVTFATSRLGFYGSKDDTVAS
jgi:hypothetical protein